MLVWVQFEVFWDRTYIDRSSSYWFSSIWVFQDRTYINWSSFYQFNSIWVFRSAPISIGHRLVSLSLSFRVGTSPISIGYLHVSFVSVFELGPHLYRSIILHISSVLVSWTTPISIGHCLINWVDFCSSLSRVCLVESSSILGHISFFGFILSEDRSFLILLIIESFIVSWSSVIHCIYTFCIIHIFG